MHINKVTYLDDFEENNSPAKVNRKTGHCFINLSRWRNILPQHRLFILLHEDAHCELNTSDEIAVDALAQKNYIKLGYPLTESVFALTRVLHGNSPESQARMWAQYQRAAAIDQAVNKKSNYDGLDALANNPNIEIFSIQESFDGEFVDVHYYDYADPYPAVNPQYSYPDISTELANIPKLSRKDRKKAKKSVRIYKRLGRSRKKFARADMVKAKANDIQAGADTRQTYADQGIYVPTRAESISKGVGESVKAVAGAVSSVFGGGGGESMESMPEQTDFLPAAATSLPKKKPADNTMLYAGGAAGILLLLGLTVVIFKN